MDASPAQQATISGCGWQPPAPPDPELLEELPEEELPDAVVPEEELPEALELLVAVAPPAPPAPPLPGVDPPPQDAVSTSARVTPSPPGENREAPGASRERSVMVIVSPGAERRGWVERALGAAPVSKR
jgi:hypothetical protein